MNVGNFLGAIVSAMILPSVWNLMKNFRQLFALVAVVILAVAVQAGSNIAVSVDASDAGRNIVRVRETIVVKPGRFTLFFPKWIPGEHAPTGPINDVVNFYVKAGDRALAWQRDDVEMFAFHVDIPEGVTSVDVSFDNVTPPSSVASANLARLKWNRLIMYPRGVPSDDIQVEATLKLPDGWSYATALPTRTESKSIVSFKPVTLTTFVDSPAIIGKYFVKVPLGGGDKPAEMDIAADSADALKYDAKTLTGWRNMIREAEAMYGARHYNSYKFLLTLSDYGGSEGLEHHESSEDGVGEKALSEREQLLDLGDLLGHEYTHSWNGKFRRPARLTTPDFEAPMHGDLLWVYEGLTQYLGRVLPARSGLWSDQMFREAVADTAAMMDYQSGRNWRPLVDTARAVQFTYPSPREWMNARRRVDYYYEGSLIWLEADVLIREKSEGKLSLDDFLKRFHGGADSAAMVKTYELADVVKTLNDVLPYDWNAFFVERVYKPQTRAPIGGILNGGWTLVYDDKSNMQGDVDEGRANFVNLTYSIGLIVNADGVVLDVNPDLAAAKAGLAPGMLIKTVNGEEFTIQKFFDAVSATKDKASSIKVEAENTGIRADYTITYKGGQRFPHLVRDKSKPDYLSGITKPIAK